MNYNKYKQDLFPFVVVVVVGLVGGGSQFFSGSQHCNQHKRLLQTNPIID